jgi:hypothetical protein
MSQEEHEASAGGANVSAKEFLAILCRPCKFERLAADIEQYNSRSEPVKNLRV